MVQADPKHLVAKHVTGQKLTPSALDPRTTFLLHTPSALFIWVGASAHADLQAAAQKAARQLVAYENAAAPTVRSQQPPVFLHKNRLFK